MGRIKEETAGTCAECGAETDIDSPVVCFGCVQQLTKPVGEGVFVTDGGEQVEGFAKDEEVPF